MDASYFQGAGGEDAAGGGAMLLPGGGGGGDALLSPLAAGSPIPPHSARGVVRSAFDRITDKVSLMLASNGGGGAQPQLPPSAAAPGEWPAALELHPPTVGARGGAIVGGFFERLRHRLMRQQQQQVDLPGMNLAGEPSSATAVGGGAAAGWNGRERSLSQRQSLLELHRRRGDTLSLDLGAGMNGCVGVCRYQCVNSVVFVGGVVTGNVWAAVLGQPKTMLTQQISLA